jgi:hypothetical protein
MTEAILNLKDLFSTTYAVWQKSFLLYCGLGAALTLLLDLPTWLLHLGPAHGVVVMILGNLAAIILYLSGMIAFSGIIARSVMGQLQGRPVVPREVLEGAKQSTALAGEALKTALRITVGLCALVVPGVVLSLRWLVVGPVTGLEKSDDAAARSNGLMEGHHALLFGFLVLIALGDALASFLLSHVVIPFDLIVPILAHSFAAVGICVAYDRAVADLGRRVAVPRLA